MTAKRYRKLCRAYFTRLNEWAKQNTKPMPMGSIYRAVSKMGNPTNMTRAEWWNAISQGEVFGVGKKGESK